MNIQPVTTQRLAVLRKLGYALAVDDLGAGYAGLSAFTMIRPEVAKIDMSLVRGVDADPTKQRLIQAMVGVCSEMGISVVMEGVETREERDTLLSLGSDLLQGYLFAKPGSPPPRVDF